MGESKPTRSLAPEIASQRGKAQSAVEANWADVQQRLRESLGTNVFNSWIRAIRIVGCKENRVTLGAPTEFRREYVTSNFHERIRLLWRQVDPKITAVEIVLDPQAQVFLSPSGPGHSGVDAGQAAVQRRPMQPQSRMNARPARPVGATTADFLSSSDPNPQYTFENFVGGKSNEIAFAAARAVAERSTKHYNPLFIHCPSGYGKTHLVNAIGVAAAKADTLLRVAYVPADKFMFLYSASAREGDTVAFKERIRAVDMLIIDDLQFICGREATLREFVATFNALYQAGKQIIVSSDRAAVDLPGLDDHIRTRLTGGLTVTIGAPDYDLRLGILRSKLTALKTSDPRLDVPDNILDFLARRIESNPRELEGGLKCVVHNSLLIGRPIPLERAQELIRHLQRAHEKRVTIEDIQKQVSAYYQVSMKDLLSHRRDRTIVRPRQVAMFLCKEMTTRSLPEIGRRFGGRDHTTVLYGIRKIGKLMVENSALADEVELLKRIIDN